MGEHDGHRERLRARLEREGIDHFAPHEVLELILFYSVPRANTNPIAHRLMERFGSLSGVLEAPPAELLKVPGVGPASAALLSSIPLFARRYLQDKNGMGIVLDTTQKLGKYILPRFVGLNNEHLYMICLDKKRKRLIVHCFPREAWDRWRLICGALLRRLCAAAPPAWCLPIIIRRALRFLHVMTYR